MILSFTLVVDGDVRSVAYRDPGAPVDAVVWLHGAGGNGQAFLEDKVLEREGVLDLGPTALAGPSGTMWIVPGEYDDGVHWPPEAADAYTDLRFLDALVDEVAIAWPTVERVWIAGFSAGAKLTWAAYAFDREYAPTVSGYGLVAHAEPVHFDFAATPKDPKPVAFWFSDDDPSNPYSRSWTESADHLAEAAECLGYAPSLPTQGCCGPLQALSVRVGLVCTVPLEEWQWHDGGHRWASCPLCRTDEHLVAFWRLSGFGT